MTEGDLGGIYEHTVSVVIPVYQGERTLRGLLDEIEAHTQPSKTEAGHVYRVSEVILVFDHGPDGSAAVIRDLVQSRPFVRAIWLSRNFGQHAATLAGMASSGGGWIVTLDEDGQHDPAYIGNFLDVALRDNVSVVYSNATNAAPHGWSRNMASALAKWLFTRVLSNSSFSKFQSYRLILGEVGRSVAAYAGAGVFLDVAIGWVAGESATCDVVLREEGDRPSGYSLRRLMSHFWRLVLSSGTRGLRLVSLTGVTLAILGGLLAIALVAARLTDSTEVEGWTSVMVAVLVFSGIILLSLGVVAEYVGVAVNMAMGKPLYLIVSDPADGPLGSRQPSS